MGEILGVRLRLIACAGGRRCLLIADKDFRSKRFLLLFRQRGGADQAAGE